MTETEAEADRDRGRGRERQRDTTERDGECARDTGGRERETE